MKTKILTLLIFAITNVALAQTYCVPLILNYTTTGYITNVQLTGNMGQNINNSSSYGIIQGYSNYSNLLVKVKESTPNQFALTTTVSVHNNYSKTIWLDLNNNGVFENSERLVYNSSQNTINLDFSKTMTNCKESIRMRIGSRDKNDPCEVNNFYGEFEDYTVELYKNAPATPSVNSNVLNNTICAGQSVTLTAYSQGATIYEWTGAGTQGILGTQIVQPTQTTTYKVKAKGGEGCLVSLEGQITITVNQKPIVTLGSNAINNTICAGETVLLTASGADSYMWNEGLGNAPAHYVTPTQTTTYKVIGNKTGCNNLSDEKTVTITVHPVVDEPTFDAIEPICIGATPPVLPTVSANGVTGSWSPSTINTATEGTQTYTFTANADQCSAIATAQMQITIAEKQTPVFTFSNVCKGYEGEVLKAISDNNISGKWSPAFDNQESTVYTFTPDATECAVAIDKVVVILEYTLPAPTGEALQQFGAGSTIADLVVNGDNLVWFSDALFTDTLSETELLEDGKTYYVLSDTGFCRSEALAVTVEQ